jgi:RNA recognition motif-containing protein
LLKNSALLVNDPQTGQEPPQITFNRAAQTPPLMSSGISATAPMNSPYTRMCDQLENFVDSEIEATDTILFNRPLEMRNMSVDLSPELEMMSHLTPSPQVQSQPQTQASSTTTNYNNSNNNNNSSFPPAVESRSLWLGNVDPTVTEGEIRATFESFGAIENVRILPAKECAFVNFYEMDAAITARNAMQGKPLGNMILRIGFGKIADNPRDPSTITQNSNASSLAHQNESQQQPRSVWIGNLAPEVTADLLMLHFNAFGPIESCRILESKNCAFVNFYTIEAASMAKIKMNGAQIGCSTIKTGNAKENTSNNNNVNNNSFSNGISDCVERNNTKPAITFASIASCNNQTSPEGLIKSPIDGSQLREFRKVIEGCPEEIPGILDELIDRGDLKELSVDSYGNILLQKIIERAAETEQALILKQLHQGIVEIAKNKNGTWVIQKLITSAASPSIQNGVIDELHERIIEMLEDQFGNYVIQCILTTLNPDYEAVRGIVEKIIQNPRKLAIGKFSSRALKSILDASNSTDRQKLIAQAVAKEAVLLSVDPNGAVVIQWILDSDLPGKIGLITGQLQGRLAQVALTKQGSVIVARILGSSDEPNYRDSAILELYDLAEAGVGVGLGLGSISSSNPESSSNGFKSTNYLDFLLAEPSTCSILFKAYQVSKPAIRLRLTEKLKPKLMHLLKEITGEHNEAVLASYTPHQRDEMIPVHLTKLYQELISNSFN